MVDMSDELITKEGTVGMKRIEGIRETAGEVVMAIRDVMTEIRGTDAMTVRDETIETDATIDLETDLETDMTGTLVKAYVIQTTDIKEPLQTYPASLAPNHQNLKSIPTNQIMKKMERI